MDHEDREAWKEASYGEGAGLADFGEQTVEIGVMVGPLGVCSGAVPGGPAGERADQVGDHVDEDQSGVAVVGVVARFAGGPGVLGDGVLVAGGDGFVGDADAVDRVVLLDGCCSL